MTDFYPMQTAGPQQEPLTINQGYNTKNMSCPGPNVTFTTHCNCVEGGLIIFFFTLGTSLFIFLITHSIIDQNGQLVLAGLVPLILIIISIVLGSKNSLCVSITVDYKLQAVIIKSKRMCFCFSKSKTIQIKEIHQVIVQTDPTNVYTCNGFRYNAYEIIFKLVDGREVKGCSGLIDVHNEGARVASILRNALPQNIIFGGDLYN